MALIAALLLLAVVTIMAVGMFRSFGVQEKIAGNTREKQRAINAAISAQNYAEWFLQQGVIPPAVSCTTVVPAASTQICNTASAPTDFTVTPWAAGNTYTPFTTTDGNANAVTSVVNSAPTIGSYYATPVYYITDIGQWPAPPQTAKGELYQVDALGYGGTPNAVAVVESTYLVQTPGPGDPGI
jgi:type IV pilus assembly protein PilX